jgi:hypothetical protein
MRTENRGHLNKLVSNEGACGSVVVWGIMLQAGRSQVRVPDEMDLLIYLMLPAALWPWSQLSLWQKRVPGIFLGIKCGWQPCRHLWTECLKMWEPQPFRNPKVLHGLYRKNFTFLLGIWNWLKRYD